MKVLVSWKEVKEIAELVKSDYRKENGLQEQLEGWEHQYLMCTQIRMDVFFSVKDSVLEGKWSRQKMDCKELMVIGRNFER